MLKLSPHEIAYVAARHWAGDDLVTAVAVALAESGGDTEALGHRALTDPAYANYDHGLWQISGKWHGEKLRAQPDWRDPFTSAGLAYAVWQGQGWSAWAVFNSGAYTKHLAAAKLAVAEPFPPPRPLYRYQLTIRED
jgi:hypothetical protein